MYTRTLLIICLLTFFLKGYSQDFRYIILDNLRDKSKITNYTLRVRDLYDYDGSIELFNIRPNPIASLPKTYSDVLILCSVLPDFESSENWSSIDSTDLKTNMISFQELLEDVTSSLNILDMQIKKDTKFLHKYQVVKKVGDQYLVSKKCLVEFYAIREYPSNYNIPYATIDTTQKKVSIRDMKNVFEGLLQEKKVFPLDIHELPTYLDDNLRVRREYLTSIFKLKDDTAYKFWTFTDWSITDGWNVDRGIDRFIYIPNKGIVGGSYDFYFHFLNRIHDSNKWFKNILNENVMIAEEFK